MMKLGEDLKRCVEAVVHAETFVDKCAIIENKDFARKLRKLENRASECMASAVKRISMLMSSPVLISSVLMVLEATSHYARTQEHASLDLDTLPGRRTELFGRQRLLLFLDLVLV